MPTLKLLTRLTPILTLALLIAAITACGSAAPPTTPTAPPTAAAPPETASPETISSETAPPAKTAPPLALSNAAGETITLNDYRGRQNVVLIFYRGFWWTTCRGQLVELQNDYPAIQELDAEIIAVSVDNLSGAARAIDALGLEYQILSDPDAQAANAYGVFNLHQNNLPTPATFIIDQQGAIRWQYIGKNARTDRPPNREIIAQLRQLS